MDGSDHSSISSSRPLKRSSTPKFSSSGNGTNENDQNYQQMGMNLQYSKTSMTKHFMSPTISAASKAIAPRKTILAERNEMSETSIQKTSNFDNSEDSYSLNDDSSFKPCHTFQKNYPSPRPQFLRYKPNRHREIVLQHQNEVKEERIKRSGSEKDISLPCKKNEEADLVCGSEEGEAIDEGAEEVEEEEEVKQWFLRMVLKLMLVLFVLVLSTLYISSMNPNETSPGLQAMEVFTDGYFKIHDHVYGTMRRIGGENFLNGMEFKEVVKIFGVVSEFLDGNMGLMKVNQIVIGEFIEEEREMVEDVYLLKVEDTGDNLRGVVELQLGGQEIEVEKKRGNSVLGEMLGLGTGETGDVCDHKTAKTGGDFDQMAEISEFKGTESVDKLESLQENQIPILSYAFQEENEYVMELFPGVNNLGDEEDLEMVESNEMTKIENIADNVREVFISESMDNEITSFEIRNFEAGSDFEGMPVIGVTTVLAIVASLVLALHLKKKRKTRKYSFPITNSCLNQSGVAEKCNSEELSNEREEQIKPSENEYVESKELNQMRAPSIELLGEFSVVEICSGSFKSCGLRSSNTGKCEVKNVSPLDEDFTLQKKAIKKEQVAATMTPIRRSSRIRSRAVTSP